MSQIPPLVRHRGLSIYHSRLLLVSALASWCLATGRIQAVEDDEGTHADWSRIVPGDVRFYAEMKDLSGARSVFRGLGLWELVRELTAETRGTASQPWHKTAEQMLGMDRDQAIDRLFGRRAALIATEPAEWQNGVLIAELTTTGEIQSLLKDWKAQTVEPVGDVKCYTLSGGFSLAIRDRIILLGPAVDVDGLWHRTVQLLSGRSGPTLAARSDFAALRARSVQSHPGFLYVAWPEGDPTAVAGCTRLLAGATVTTSEITCDLEGHRPKRATPNCDLAAMEMIPASTLCVVTEHYDFPALARRARSGKILETESFFAYLVCALSETQGQSSELLDALGPAYTLLLGRQPTAAGLNVEIPTLAAILPTREGPATVEMLDHMMFFLSNLVAVLGGAVDESQPDIAVQREMLEGVSVHRVALGPPAARRLNLPMLADVEPCWCLVNDRLVLSTSPHQIREIIMAAKGKSPGLSQSDTFRERMPSLPAAKVEQWVMLRGAGLSRMIEGWLRHLERDQPEMLGDDWWRQWAASRVDRHTRLGVELGPDRTSPVRAVVRDVESTSPAREYLRPGDIILGAAGRALTTTRPAQEVANRYRDRGGAKQFHLRVQRAGEILDLHVPVQPANPIDLRDFDPMTALRRIAVLTRRVDTLTVERRITSPERFTARIAIRWEAAR